MRISDWSSDVCSSDLFLFTAVIYLFLGAPADLLAQEHLSVSGRVLDAGTAVPLSGVSVSVKGKPLGTATDTAGDFELSVALSPPLTLDRKSTRLNSSH